MDKKRALVTGGNRGIGFAIAKGLIDQGHEVMLGARDVSSGEKAARRIGAIPLELDVSDNSSIANAVKQAGRVDVLINNAGVLGSGGILSDPRDFEESLAVMVHGPYFLMHHLIPILENGRPCRESWRSHHRHGSPCRRR